MTGAAAQERWPGPGPRCLPRAEGSPRPGARPAPNLVLWSGRCSMLTSGWGPLGSCSRSPSPPSPPHSTPSSPAPSSVPAARPSGRLRPRWVAPQPRSRPVSFPLVVARQGQAVPPPCGCRPASSGAPCAPLSLGSLRCHSLSWAGALRPGPQGGRVPSRGPFCRPAGPEAENATALSLRLWLAWVPDARLVGGAVRRGCHRGLRTGHQRPPAPGRPRPPPQSAPRWTPPHFNKRPRLFEIPIVSPLGVRVSQTDLCGAQVGSRPGGRPLGSAWRPPGSPEVGSVCHVGPSFPSRSEGIAHARHRCLHVLHPHPVPCTPLTSLQPRHRPDKRTFHLNHRRASGTRENILELAFCHLPHPQGSLNLTTQMPPSNWPRSGGLHAPAWHQGPVTWGC